MIVQDRGEVRLVFEFDFDDSRRPLMSLGGGEGRAFFETGGASVSETNGPGRIATCDDANPAKCAFRNDPIRFLPWLLPAPSPPASASRSDVSILAWSNRPVRCSNKTCFPVASQACGGRSPSNARRAIGHARGSRAQRPTRPSVDLYCLP